MIRTPLETVATSRADDAAYRALADIVAITSDFSDARIVGGHMVNLLTTAFPTPEAVIRRTADADAAISTAVATAGHDQIGGWKLDGPDLMGTRLDTALTLHTLAGRARRSPLLRRSEVPTERLIALIRALIAHPVS